ncbi:MAG TPA: hypothetical protein VK524_07150 [Polyangiaceae bacterium]|nr:hypothetical protein [Polyangiaceae bacterium]
MPQHPAHAVRGLLAGAAKELQPVIARAILIPPANVGGVYDPVVPQNSVREARSEDGDRVVDDRALAGRVV